MAANMMKSCTAFAFLCICAVPQAWGQVLPDPTRPPFGINDAVSGLFQAEQTQTRGLQSVIMSHGRCAAIINGKNIALGEKYGSERLIEVNERGVVLQGEYGRRALTLYSNVGIKITEAMPQDRQLFECKAEKNKQTKNPAVRAGQKEKK